MSLYAHLDQGVLKEFLDESQELLGDIPNLFIQLEKNPAKGELVNTIAR